MHTLTNETERIETPERLDLGASGFRLPGVPILFGSEQRARDWAIENKHLGQPVLSDTRPTVGDVVDMLSKVEGRPSKTAFAGSQEVDPWDEYFKESAPADMPWPDDWRWLAVYVVTGGSEGTYLHVDAIRSDGKRQLLILGKTCAYGFETWKRCHESAARIAWRLSA